jgi:CubicO group peptidase (beta-lactamase class C family)
MAILTPLVEQFKMWPESARIFRMQDLGKQLDAVAGETGFSGVVRVDRGTDAELARAYGLADRAYEIPNSVATRFGIASGTKGLTAVAIASLVEDGLLALSTPARSVLGNDLPLVGDDVTVEHLLSHRSGIGDYLDENVAHDVDDYLMPVPGQELATTEGYLRVLDGHATKFAPGERFAYCNSGYVVLALIAERVSGVPFAELVRERVCEPAGMVDSAFLRSDELPARAARGYLTADGPRTNVFHLPVRGSGDGGIYSTVADVSSFWRALFAGEIVSVERVAELLRPRSEVPRASLRYGLGFWLAASGEAAILEGSDAGISFRSVHDPTRELTHTVISNTSEGAWPIARLLLERL